MLSRRRSLSASTNLSLSLILVLLFAIVRSSVAQFQNNFDGYPSGTQSCLYQASNSSGCDGATSQAMNKCLCSNGGDFVTNSAKCIAQEDPADMTSAFTVLQSNCRVSDTPLSISLSQWMALASGITSSKSSSTPTATSSAAITTKATSTADSTATSGAGNSKQSGISSGAKIGIIAGASVAGVAILAAAAVFIVRHRKRRHHYDEVHPMMANSQNSPFGSGYESSTYPSHHTGHVSYGPSELDHAMSTMDTPRTQNTWLTSSDGASVPWSPGALEAVKANARLQNLHQIPPQEGIYEMPAESTHASLAAPPAEVPTISVTSPVELDSPSSRYSGPEHPPSASEQSEWSEPYRPRRNA